MSYLRHAEEEFKALGYKPVSECEDTPEKWIQENVFELLDVIDKQGHSGHSIGYVIDLFSKMAMFKPVAPLSGKDEEWSEYRSGSFQNKRCSHIFKDENGEAYDINGYVFWHWSERPLDEDETGFPGTKKFKSYFTSHQSRKPVTFPHTVGEPEYVEVDCFEVNKETGEREPGSGWWETIYPNWMNTAQDSAK